MSLLVPLVPDPDAALARFNPVAKIAAAGILMVGLLLTLDPVTPAVLLAIELALVPSTGVSVPHPGPAYLAAAARRRRRGGRAT